MDTNTKINESVFKILLLEGEIIRWTKGAWNHWIIGSGTWDGFSGCHSKEADYENLDLSGFSTNRFLPIMLMPYHSAIPLSQLSRIEQRKLFPRILPSLWDALCVMHHGDLSQSNILMNTRKSIFHLIDPGVVLSSTAHDSLYANNQSLFTTNAANYPLIRPFQNMPKIANQEIKSVGHSLQENIKILVPSLAFDCLQCGDFGIYDLSSRTLSWTEYAVQVNLTTAPHPADLLALGIIYYRILTGNELFLKPDIMEKPAWQGVYGEFVGDSNPMTAYKKIIDLLENGYINSQIDQYDFNRDEKVLVNSLLNLAIANKDELLKLSSF